MAVQGKVIRRAFIPSALANGLAGLVAGLLVIWVMVNAIISRPVPNLNRHPRRYQHHSWERA
ncbi:MAG UNVERIFIED_CONTAM: hypothetical protein LVT10_11070 [Anaerolineae bacterium]